MRASKEVKWACLALAIVLAGARNARAGDAPAWMHAAANAPLPDHDEKTDAVLLYAEENYTVISADKVKGRIRRVYKILRPGGREYGTIDAWFSPNRKITSMHGWCIPASGKDYEVKDKDAIESAIPWVESGELISDIRVKHLLIPAPDPGNVVGYEYETEEQPLVLHDIWMFQGEIPTRESHYTLQIPPGWEYKATWINHVDVQPAVSGNGTYEWLVNDVKGIRHEEEMPPLNGVAGQMLVSFYPPGGPAVRGYRNWQEMGTWYSNLTLGRRDASPEIKQEVAALAASKTTPLAKMQAIAQFVQHDIRYVAIELGIGGFQPHSATEVFAHRYGDCKDKATLASSMLHEIGIESYYVVINANRGSVTKDSPAGVPFNHMILAIRLPDSLKDPTLMAVVERPKEGRLLFFDPTNELTPFGQISGELQANYGLLVGPEGGELLELPMQPSFTNSIQRTGNFTIDSAGNLQGSVEELRSGDRAAVERSRQRRVTAEADRIKPIENLLAGSLSSFHITKASVINLAQTSAPFGFTYTFSTENYAKNAGDLLLLRPRVLGTKSRALMEAKEPRRFPVEFSGPVLDTDKFEIVVPTGYVVDDVPPAVDVDYSFASYHSKTEVTGNTVRYTRRFEIKELSVPVSEAEDLKKFYRLIATDERNTAVLKASK
ncbi:MAG TPA: DUF3857 and transglutaminase domain-containing protein [Terriglobales bacterium]|nr:DUF3857 and transglutaminase domain-containing protein [Terriglobales bacterium]